jgi:hypothetical protein
LLITASDQFQNPFENVWEKFVGAVAIDAKDGTKGKGSRASDTGWSVGGTSEDFFLLSFSLRVYNYIH